MKLLRTLATTSFLLALNAGPALGQSAADKATARDLAEQGANALDKKDYETALDRFSRANALFPAPSLALGVARAQVGLGKLVTAKESYNAIVREGVKPGDPDAFKRAVADAQKELNALEPRIPKAVIAVKGPDQPSVKLDGEAFPNAALGIERPVNPGTHTLSAEGPGYAPKETSFEVAEGKTINVELVLDPGEGSSPLVPVVPPGDGTGASSAPSDTASSDGGDGPTWMTPVGAVLLAVGGAGLVVGGITGGLAIGKRSELTDNCDGNSCPRSQQDTLDSFHLMGTLSTVSFIAGGVLAAGGVVLLVLAPSDDGPQSMGMSPYVGPAELGVVGRF